ncbi:MAG: hypothetical protein ABFD86_15555 [Bryobacteraceae bacterium]
MSHDSELATSAAGSLDRGRFRYFPVAPGRLEFAIELRRAILEMQPAVVAVELPTSLEGIYRDAVARLPEMSVVVYPDATDPERAVYVPVEPADPFTEAVRTAGETGAEVMFLEPGAGARPHLPDAYPDPYALRSVGLDKYVEAYRIHPQERDETVAAHAAGMAWKLQGSDPEARVMVVVSLNLLDALLDAMEAPQDEPPRSGIEEVQLLNPHPDCLVEITTEYPFLQWRYENYRSEMSNEKLADRRWSQLALLREAERQYEKNAGEKIQQWQRRLMARYTRNLALVSGGLVAGLFDLTVAARSIADDNYAWEVWDVAGRYPAQKVESDLETVNLSGEEVWINMRKMRLRRRLPHPKQRLRPASLKPRKKEIQPGEWARNLDGNTICSYPPEDLVIENYGQILKAKAKSILSEERVRTEPFTTSVRDGIDLRETIRNWYEKKIYVREFDKISGEVGALVVIYDEDREDRYTYLTTWLGEHQNESDMAFYSTDPFANMVGPGIGRAEYGGFLMTLPPRRMVDVWGDPDYWLAETKPERLLLAALDYSIYRHVVYVAVRPPRSIFRTIAYRLGRSILYVPIGQLAPAKLKKIRVVHVLDSYARREEAKDYLW